MASRNDGLNPARSASRSSVEREGACPSRTRARRQPIATIRPKTWDRGRNSRVEAGYFETDLKTGWSSSMALSTSAKKFAWVRTQPLGLPVVPDV